MSQKPTELLNSLNKANNVRAEVSCIILELEEHQRALEEMIGNEPDMVIRGQADQYQTDLNKAILAYSKVHELMKK